MFRCLLGAGIVAAVDSLRRIMGNGWLFVMLSGACVIVVLPLIAYVRIRGPKLREGRRLKREEENERKRAEAEEKLREGSEKPAVPPVEVKSSD